MSKQTLREEVGQAQSTPAPQTEALEKIQQGAPPAVAQEADRSLTDMLAEDAGLGFANMGANDFAIPFVSILQKGSPQVSRANAKYIKGAEQGMIMNTVTMDVYPGEPGVLYVPCGYSKSIVEWVSRDKGGGLVAHHKEGDKILKGCERNDRGQLVHKDTGNVFVDTAYHFGLLLHDEAYPEMAIVSMYSTGLKISRMWNTMMRNIIIDVGGKKFNPPTYAYKYRLSTIGVTKDSYDWFSYKVVSEGRVEDVELYKIAREFSKQVESGNVRISAPPQDADAVSDPDSVPF
jgi:hypothetical protein